MQLNVTTDYAIRIVLYLAQENKISTSIEISDAMRIPSKDVLNIARKLVAADIIKRKVGASGGFSLNKPAKDITVFDVINTLEPTMNINRCLYDDEYCSRFATKKCPLRKFYVKLQKNVEENLKSTTIGDLLKK